MSTKFIYGMIVFMILVLSTPLVNNAQTFRDSLNQYVAALQKSPNDSALRTNLRTKIILLAQTIKPAPAVPDEMERYMVRGKTALELAKESKDYKNAIAEFTKATLAAPWLGNGYFNLAVVQELSADYNSAIRNYKFYLLAEPDGIDAKDVKAKIYELEYKNEQADKLEKQKQAVKQAQITAQQAQEAAKEQRRSWIKGMVPWFNYLYGNPILKGWTHVGPVILGQEEQGDWSQMANNSKKLSTNLLSDNRRFLFSIAGPDNDQIQLTLSNPGLGRTEIYYGVATGIQFENINWTKDDNSYVSIKILFAKDNPSQPIIQIVYGCKNGVCTNCDQYLLELKK